jgi:hypothetical protein
MLEGIDKLFLTEHDENGKKLVTAVINPETRWKYLLISLVLAFSLNYLKNAIHEVAHAAMILILGGKITTISIQFNIGYVNWVETSVPATSYSLIYVAGVLGEFFFFYTPGIMIFRHNKNHVLVALIGYWMVMLYLLSLFYWCGGSYYPIFQYYDSIGFSNGIGVNSSIIGTISIFPTLLAVWFCVHCTMKLRNRFLHDEGRTHVYITILVYFLVLLLLKMTLPQF